MFLEHIVLKLTAITSEFMEIFTSKYILKMGQRPSKDKKAIALIFNLTFLLFLKNQWGPSFQ